MYIVYIIECADGTLYTGITTDLKRRLKEHRAGIAAKYTKVHGFKKLRYQEMSANRSDASVREYEIKQLTRPQKLNLCKSYTQLQK